MTAEQECKKKNKKIHLRRFLQIFSIAMIEITDISTFRGLGTIFMHDITKATKIRAHNFVSYMQHFWYRPISSLFFNLHFLVALISKLFGHFLVALSLRHEVQKHKRGIFSFRLIAAKLKLIKAQNITTFKAFILNVKQN
jgi:hypothetical protein